MSKRSEAKKTLVAKAKAEINNMTQYFTKVNPLPNSWTEKEKLDYIAECEGLWETVAANAEAMKALAYTWIDKTQDPKWGKGVHTLIAKVQVGNEYVNFNQVFEHAFGITAQHGVHVMCAQGLIEGHYVKKGFRIYKVGEMPERRTEYKPPSGDACDGALKALGFEIK